MRAATRVNALRLVGDVADSILRIADRGDDGARAVGATDDDDDVGFAWSGRRRASAASYGVIDQRWPNSTALYDYSKRHYRSSLGFLNA